MILSGGIAPECWFSVSDEMKPAVIRVGNNEQMGFQRTCTAIFFPSLQNDDGTPNAEALLRSRSANGPVTFHTKGGGKVVKGKTGTIAAPVGGLLNRLPSPRGPEGLNATGQVATGMLPPMNPPGKGGAPGAPPQKQKGMIQLRGGTMMPP